MYAGNWRAAASTVPLANRPARVTVGGITAGAKSKRSVTETEPSSAPVPARKAGAAGTSTAPSVILAALRQGLDALGVGLPPLVLPLSFEATNTTRKRPREATIQHQQQQQQLLLCREGQVEAIKEFLQDESCTTLQLFGMPGTGKTAAVKYAIRTLGGGDSAVGGGVSAVFVNGYVIHKNADLYQAIYAHLSKERLEGKSPGVPAEQCAAALERRFRTGWGSASSAAAAAGQSKRTGCGGKQLKLCVIVIDEMDKCLEKCSKGILKLVDWLTLPHARCKLISIANSMEVSVDAKTRSRLDSTRKVVFPPYVMQELQQILLQRVAHITPKLLADSAVSFVCRQTASQSGDVRRLLQSTAAAVHDLICTLEEDPNGGGVRDVSSGIVTVHQVSSVVSRVFQDRFQEFLKEGVMSPLMFLLVCAVTVEAERQEKQQHERAANHDERAGGSTVLANGVLFERLFSATCGLLHTFRPAMAFPSDFRLCRSRFIFLLDMLRQVGLVDVSCGPDHVSVASVREVVEWASESVRIVMLQPPSVVAVLCKLHEKFGKLVVGLFEP
jgi:origin recognition complex subunit 1